MKSAGDKKKILVAIGVCVAAGTCFMLYRITKPAMSAGGYQATGDIGQVDNDNSPSFISNYTDNTLPQQTINPAGTALDLTGHRLFVSDTHCNQILVYPLNANNRLVNLPPLHVLGQADLGNSCANLSEDANTFSNPQGLAYDPIADRLFVADTSDNRVLVFNTAPSTMTDDENADIVLGQSDFVSNGNGVTSSTFDRPVGLAYDTSNNVLFVSDTNNLRVLAFDVASSTITDGEGASYVLGQPDFVSSGGSVTSSSFEEPDGLAYDSLSNNLYVGDYSNNRVLAFDVASSTITDGEGASYVLGQPDFTSDGTSQPASVTIESPSFISVNPGSDIFVAANVGGQRVSMFDIATSTIADGEENSGTLGGAGATGLGLPTGDAVDSLNHRFFVSDTANNRILVYNLDSNNGFVTSTASYVLGQPDFISSSAGTTSSTLNEPYNLAYDAGDSLLFVSDYANARVLAFDVATSTITDGEGASYVLGQPDFTSRSTGTTSSTFAVATGLAYDDADNELFVADTFNFRVLIFDVASSTIADVVRSRHC